MRRLLLASLALPMALLLAVGPVAADTTPGGGSGTYFSSFTFSCTGSPSRAICTETYLDVHPLEDGASEACLDIFTYSISRSRSAFVSDTYGCGPGSVIVGADYSATMAPTGISMQTCAAHKKTCSGSTSRTVSARDSPVSDPATTTSRTVTKVGTCTYTTRSTQTDVELAGTITIDGTTMDESGFVSVVDSTTTVRCK
jgi:hypothetical protein